MQRSKCLFLCLSFDIRFGPDIHGLPFVCRRERVTASGGEVGRLSIFGGAEVGFFCALLDFMSHISKHS